MGDRDQRKQSIYLPEPMLAELRAEAARTDRSLSWLIQKAWKVARVQMARLPSIEAATSEPTSTGAGRPVPDPLQ